MWTKAETVKIVNSGQKGLISRSNYNTNQTPPPGYCARILETLYINYTRLNELDIRTLVNFAKTNYSL
jgi:hypothetical protein